MRKILFVLLVLTTAVISCKKEVSVDPSNNGSNSVSSLPLKATAYIEDNYPDASVDYFMTVTNSPVSFLVTLTTLEELAFNKTGNFIGLGSQFQNIIKSDTIHCHSGGHGNIPIDSLPGAITGYVAVNYPGYAIRHARYDSLCAEGLVIGLMISTEGYEPVKLNFTTSGDFLMLANRMLYNDLPQVVTDFIAGNYAGFTISDKAEKFTLASGDFQYVVYMKQDSVRQSVRVDAQGVLVCEQSGHNGGQGHGGGHHGGGHGGGGHHGGQGSIPLDSLPTAIMEYVSANYAGFSLREAHFDSICSTGLAIRVMISETDHQGMILFFDTAGNFLMLADKIAYNMIPEIIRNYIIENYPGWQPGKSDQLTLADGTLQYMIGLMKPHHLKRLTFDATGNLLCEL